MEIESGNYVLKSDNYNLWIEKKGITKKKDGTEAETSRKVAGFSSTFEALLLDFAKVRIKSSESTNMKELLKEASEIEKELLDMARDFGKGLDAKYDKG